MNHLCFFFLSLFVFNCGAEITSSCGKKIVTGTSKDYTQLTYEIMGIDSITFGVAAKNDVHVALDNRFAGLNLDGAAMWEIVLGGWGDTQSVIRDRFAGDNLVSKPSRINSETSFQYFWISWKKYGKNEIISVGTGTTVGVNELMVYHFAASTAIPIGFVHFSTGFGSAGSWDFCNTKFKVPILNSCGSYGFDLFTGYDKNYQQFTAPLVGVTSFVFGVVASNDVHIALDNRILGDNSEGDYMWEIVLGGWGNTQSVIRNRNNGQNLATVMSVYRLLNIATYNYFWVSWANGLLSVGSGVRVGENQIMAFPTVLALLNVPFPIGYVHLSTGYGSPGYWDFCKTVYISTSSTTTSTSTSTTTSTTSTSTTTERPSTSTTTSTTRRATTSTTTTRRPVTTTTTASPKTTTTTSQPDIVRNDCKTRNGLSRHFCIYWDGIPAGCAYCMFFGATEYSTCLSYEEVIESSNMGRLCFYS